VTHFVDDLIDVFVEPEFPREVEGFWLKSKTNEILPKHVKPIDDLSQILDYV
jgi:hypothetical protein